MFPILQVGPAAIQMPGLLILLGIWVAYILAERAAKQQKLETKAISNLIMYSLIAALIGARLGYALQFLDLYLEEPLELVALNMNTFSLRGGLLAGILVGVIYGSRKELPLWTTLDVLAPGFAIFLVFLGLAHLAGGDAFGAPTNVPWAIELWGAMRHPSQIYEIIVSLAIFLVVLLAGRRSPFPGFVFLLFILLTSTSRLFLETFRGDSILLFEVVRRDQLFYLTALLASMIGLGVLARGVSESTQET